jgi:cell wall-associated NlpC family hydrolase
MRPKEEPFIPLDRWLTEINRWKDSEAPYHHQQASIHGCDCIGLVLGALKECGKDYLHFDQAHRPESPKDDYMERMIKDHSEECGMCPGAIVLFYVGKCPYARHIAIVEKPPFIIHSALQEQKVALKRLEKRPSIRYEFRWMDVVKMT